MQSSTWLTAITICISFSALIVSVIALWKNYFGKFKPITTTGSLRFRIYPIKSGSDKWYIPSFNVAVSITNKGVLPGTILGMRITVSYPQLPIPGNKEIFEPKWEINYPDYNKNAQSRFLWIDTAVINNWMPYVILPKCTVTKHFIFETRWDDVVIQELQIKLEMYTDAYKKWNVIDTWYAHLVSRTWSELADVGNSISIEPENTLKQGPSLLPPDLHKYTGTKERLPSNGFNANPSYLSYPERGKDAGKSTF